MDIPNQAVQQILATSKPKTNLSSDTISRALEANGWKRSVAGDVDFDKAVRGIKVAMENNRGILLVGNAGVGKTALLKVIHKILKGEISQFVYCKDENALGWMKNSKDFYLKRSVYVDDIGSEDVIKSYGNTTDVVGDFIQTYYDKGHGRFFGSTNLRSAELNNKYGTRVTDRLFEMCVCVVFEGKSKRKKIVV